MAKPFLEVLGNCPKGPVSATSAMVAGAASSAALAHQKHHRVGFAINVVLKKIGVPQFLSKWL